MPARFGHYLLGYLRSFMLGIATFFLINLALGFALALLTWNSEAISTASFGLVAVLYGLAALSALPTAALAALALSALIFLSVRLRAAQIGAVALALYVLAYHGAEIIASV